MRQFVLLLVAVFLVQCVRSVNVTPRIVGGQVTTISREPYIVSLWYNGQFICGGSLVSAQHVVTAAHCVKGRAPRSFSVKAGVSQLSETGVTSDVTEITVPPIFNRNTMNKDVAVLKLARAVTGPNISPIPLCSSAVRAGNVLHVSGWGITSESSGTVQNQLRTVQMPVIARAQCQRRYSFQKRLTRTMMCARKAGKDSCSGDSGGPAVRNGELCGVVSWGVGCARPQYPGVYTNVFAVRNFIESAMRR